MDDLRSEPGKWLEDDEDFDEQTIREEPLDVEPYGRPIVAPVLIAAVLVSILLLAGGLLWLVTIALVWITRAVL